MGGVCVAVAIAGCGRVTAPRDAGSEAMDAPSDRAAAGDRAAIAEDASLPDGREAAVVADAAADNVPRDTAAMPDAPPADTAPADTAPACRVTDECGRGLNCIKGRCVAAPVSCAAYAVDDPTAGDGVYWINPSGVPQHAYCDMREKLELCTEIEGDHRGVTRDSSRLQYRMISLLDLVTGVCKIRALRASDGNPIDDYRRTDPTKRIDVCKLLGFVANGEVGTCKYGEGPEHSSCKFPLVAPLYRWGTLCAGCDNGNDGEFDHFVLQGRMNTATIITSYDGAVTTTCKVR
jgi:hypothetical protein